MPREKSSRFRRLYFLFCIHVLHFILFLCFPPAPEKITPLLTFPIVTLWCYNVYGMESPELISLLELSKMPVNPLVFWGVITVTLVVVMALILNSIGVITGVYWLILVPVVAYLVVMGLFIFYLFKLYAERNRLMVEKIRREETKVGEFKKLNQDLEFYAKQLFDKDFELTLANKRLQNLEQAKSKFVSVTTHQLRTPLSAI